MNTFLRKTLAGAVATLGLIGVAQAEPVVHVYNWTDYIGETTLADFQKATGIKPGYDVFDEDRYFEPGEQFFFRCQLRSDFVTPGIGQGE